MVSDYEFWESRYRNREYIYGRIPNHYFREKIKTNTLGKLLCLCEGEGRNAAYAAYTGWPVVAMDFNEKARDRAIALAESKNVRIEFHVSDIADYHFPPETYNYVAIIHCHFRPELRKQVFQNVIKTLKPGGGIFFEGFSTEQFGRESGGPADFEKYYTLKEIEEELLPGFEFRELYQIEYRMNEGLYHVGMSNLIRFLAFKP